MGQGKKGVGEVLRSLADTKRRHASDRSFSYRKDSAHSKRRKAGSVAPELALFRHSDKPHITGVAVLFLELVWELLGESGKERTACAGK